MFVCVSCQKMAGMRQRTDLIVSFTSVCLQQSAGEREMHTHAHTPNTHHILHLHGEICLTFRIFMELRLSCRKMPFWFTLSTASRSRACTVPASRLPAAVVLTYLQSGRAHCCCWSLRPEHISVMSNNCGQQSPCCYTEDVLFNVVWLNQTERSLKASQ